MDKAKTLPAIPSPAYSESENPPAGDFGRMSRVALLLGAVSVISALAIGWTSWQKAITSAERQRHADFLHHARQFAAMAEALPTVPDDELLTAIEEAWADSDHQTPDIYISILDRHARAIAHTAAPDLLGVPMGSNAVTGNATYPPGSLLDLVQSKREYVGGYRSTKGNEQIAAFVPIPQRHWTLGIHQSKDAIAQEVHASARFLATGFLAICGLLMPASLIVLYWTFRTAQRRRQFAENVLRTSQRRLRCQSAVLLELANKATTAVGDHRNILSKIIRADAETMEVERASVWLLTNHGATLYCESLYERGADRLTYGMELSTSDLPMYFAALERDHGIAASAARTDPRTREFTDAYFVPLGIVSLLDAPIRLNGQTIGVLCHEHVGAPRQWALEEQHFADSVAHLISLAIATRERVRAEAQLRQTNTMLMDAFEQQKCTSMKLEAAVEQVEAASREVEAASRAKSEFLANMSHEIRTPINGIVGIVDMLKRSNLTDEQHTQLCLVDQSAELLLGVINDVLDLSKVEAGKLELDPIDFDLRDCLVDMLRALAPGASQKGLAVLLHVAHDVPEALLGDIGRLRQIIINLVGNAIKFTEDGEVTVRVVATSHKDGDLEVQFTISDTGIGIPANKQKLIFDAFTQADRSTTRVFGGTGLGLAITSRLVDLMGGRIWVESKPGEGSRFHFTARFAVRDQPPPTPAEMLLEGLAGTPVLVVDDNVTSRRLLAETLTNWGLTPSTVGNGVAALAKLEQTAAEMTPFALVLLDIGLRQLDGLAIAEQIQAHSELRQTAIVALISPGRLGDAEHCRARGITACTNKPLKPSELLDAITMTLSGTCPVGPWTVATATGTSSSSERAWSILLVEDNAVNRMVAVTILQDDGHMVTVAKHGKEALAVLERNGKAAYDLILMDVQMPIMDGFTATEAIRKAEAGANDHIPIIAMTANAMKGDREKCLAVGMDDYLAKPVRIKDLRGVLAKWDAACHARRCAHEESRPEAPAVDIDAALDNLNGNRRIFDAVLDEFLENLPATLRDIQVAAAAANAAELTIVAHGFKGAAANICAEPTRRAAERLETLAADGDLRDLAAALNNLEQSVEELRRYVENDPRCAGAAQRATPIAPSI